MNATHYIETDGGLIDEKENEEGREGRRADMYAFICGSLLMVFATDARVASNLKTIFAFENIF